MAQQHDDGKDQTKRDLIKNMELRVNGNVKVIKSTRVIQLFMLTDTVRTEIVYTRKLTSAERDLCEKGAANGMVNRPKQTGRKSVTKLDKAIHQLSLGKFGREVIVCI